MTEDSRFDYGEQRFRAFGMIEKCLYVIAFTRRGELVRVISLRKANKREVTIMDKKLQKPPLDADDIPLTDEMIAKMRPASEVMPDLLEAYERGDLQNNLPRRWRGTQKKAVKVQTTIRIDEDVVAYFKKGGRGWQTRINDTLRETVFGQK